MTYDHKDIIKATYHGNTPSECSHIIISYLEYTRFNELIEERCDLETGRQYDSLEPFKDWWNEYISDEEDFVEEEPTTEPTTERTFNDHQTYNIMFAIASLQEGLEVYVDGSLSNEPDRRLYTVSAIGDCDDHMFIIKKGKAA